MKVYRSIFVLVAMFDCASASPQQPAAARREPSAAASAKIAKPPVPTRRVALHVNSESWVKGSSFPRAELTSRCNAAGISLSPTDGELDVTIDYTESKGSGYSLFGIGTPSAWGTDITYAITILSSDGAETLLKRTAHASTPSSNVSSGGLHDLARRAFMTEKAFTESCSMIGALLGSHAEQAKLLQWAVVDPEGRTLLEKAGFEPRTPPEVAYVRIIRREFDQLGSLEGTGASALKLYLRSFYDREIGWVGDNRKESSSAVIAAIQAYAASSDASKNAVLAKLIEQRCCLSGPDRNAIQKAVLEAARDKGDRSLLKPLADWREGIEQYYRDLVDLLPLAEAARAAIAARNPGIPKPTSRS